MQVKLHLHMANSMNMGLVEDAKPRVDVLQMMQRTRSREENALSAWFKEVIHHTSS